MGVLVVTVNQSVVWSSSLASLNYIAIGVIDVLYGSAYIPNNVIRGDNQEV